MKFLSYYKLLCKLRNEKPNYFISELDPKKDRLYDKTFQLNGKLDSFLEKIQLYQFINFKKNKMTIYKTHAHNPQQEQTTAALLKLQIITPMQAVLIKQLFMDHLGMIIDDVPYFYYNAPQRAYWQKFLYSYQYQLNIFRKKPDLKWFNNVSQFYIIYERGKITIVDGKKEMDMNEEEALQYVKEKWYETIDDK